MRISQRANRSVQLDRVRPGSRLDVDGLRLRAGERLLVHGPNGAGDGP
ncbi:hypothetical protein ACFP1Z_26290 [Streptomyces gamaensis]|uniref:Uncharacterized protein n=1 Tax=Streptomyces gamaensis TaxID=1763542 RepID=A0ABW0Z9G7_9ACTN